MSSSAAAIASSPSSSLSLSQLSLSKQTLRTPLTSTLINASNQKTDFHGLSLREGKRATSAVLLKRRNGRRGLEVNARSSAASKTIEVEVDKPLGLTLGQKPGGGVIVTVSNTYLA